MSKLNENVEQKIKDLFLQYFREKKSLPWQSGLLMDGGVFFGRGRNGRPYNGINALLTFMDFTIHGYDCTDYITFKEIKERGGMLKEGSKGVPIVYWLFLPVDEKGKVLTKDEAKRRKEAGIEVKEACVGLKNYYVYNLACTNLPYEKIKEADRDRLKKDRNAEEIVNAYLDNGGPKLILREGFEKGDGSYSPLFDTLNMYPMHLYKDEVSYYATFFHEMIHSTGHCSRLDRPLRNKFGSPAYAKEELIAEIGASLLMEQAGLQDEANAQNQYAYIKGWESRVMEGKDFVHNFTVALGKAVTAANWILTAGEQKEVKTA